MSETMTAANGDNRPFPNYEVMPDPTPEMLASPQFEAIWRVIKTWDVNVPEAYSGYCGANGSHVAMILRSLAYEAAKPAAEASGSGEAVAWVQPGYLSMLQKYGSCSMRFEPIEALDYIVPLYATPPAPLDKAVEALEKIARWEKHGGELPRVYPVDIARAALSDIKGR